MILSLTIFTIVISDVSMVLTKILILYRRICLDSERIRFCFGSFDYFTDNLRNKWYQDLEHTFSRVFVGKKFVTISRVMRGGGLGCV